MVGKAPKQVSMKLMASLAPARAEVEAGAVAKADQYFAVTRFSICLLPNAYCKMSCHRLVFLKEIITQFKNFCNTKFEYCTIEKYVFPVCPFQDLMPLA